MESTTFEEGRAALVALEPVLRRLTARVDQVDSADLGPLCAELDELKTVLAALKVELLEEAQVRGEAWAGGAAYPGSGRSFFT